jgi:hypothetical protein
MWAGVVTFIGEMVPGRYRLLIEEREFISAGYVTHRGDRAEQPGRLIYIETVALDELLLPQS